MRAFLFFVLLMAGVLPASAEEWTSRHGACYDWEGRWDIQQESSGVWVGFIDFIHVGGSCAAGTNTFVTYEARAVIVGNEFFARRVSGSSVCFFHGTIRGAEVRGGEVRGTELCTGGTTSFLFALRFAPRQGR